MATTVTDTHTQNHDSSALSYASFVHEQHYQDAKSQFNNVIIREKNAYAPPLDDCLYIYILSIFILRCVTWAQQTNHDSIATNNRKEEF